MKINNKEIIGLGLIVLAGIFWGTSGIFGSILMDSGVAPGFIGVFRLGVGACFLGCIMFFKDPSLFKIGWEGFFSIAFMGLITQSSFNYTYFKAVHMTTPSTAVVLLYTSPIFLLVFGMLFYKEKSNIRKVLAVVLCLAGCYLTASEGNLSNLVFNATGLLYGLGAGFAYSLITIFYKELLKYYNSFTILFYSFIAGSMGLFIISMPQEFSLVNWSFKTISALIGLGLFPGALAYACYISGLARGIEASRAGILSSFEIISGVFFAFFALGDSISLYKFIGVAAVFASIILVNKPKQDIDKSDLECISGYND